MSAANTGAFAVGVCGFGRCGSTMTMAMLDAGGCPPVEGAAAGSYEHPDVEQSMSLPAGAYIGRAVKVLDAMALMPLPDVPWRFVWLDRDPIQQALSAIKLMQHLDVMPPFDNDRQGRRAVWTLSQSYAVDRPRLLGALRSVGPVVVLKYEDVLAVPKRAAKMLARVWPDLDRMAAAAVVHDRDGRVRPDLAAEVAAVAS